jgi:HD-GYP domain-containing protein (c-di-GMP phosphodiesterase class II)
LRGEEIPLAARIVAVCDAFEAITGDRCYRKARSAEVARCELLREAGYQFDPGVVAAFLDELDQPQDSLAAMGAGEESPGQFAEEVAARFRQLLEPEPSP